MIKFLILSEGLGDKRPDFRFDPKEIFICHEFLVVFEFVVKKLFMEFPFINNLKNGFIEVGEINKTRRGFSSEDLIPGNDFGDVLDNLLWAKINVRMAFGPDLLDAKYCLFTHTL